MQGGSSDNMSRMDKYEEFNDNQYSRTAKNEDLYKDVYLNNTLIDLNKIIDDEVFDKEEEKKEMVEIKEYHYEEKNYNLNKFLNGKPLPIGDNWSKSPNKKNLEVSVLTFFNT